MSKVEKNKKWKSQFVQSEYFSAEGWNFYSVTIPSLDGPFLLQRVKIDFFKFLASLSMCWNHKPRIV